MEPNNIPWWKNAVVYQIYPLSFCDSNGDGIGDLNGISSRLDYLKNLGVDVLWLSPVYRSPMDDNGYDISDYYDIDPMFGTMADFRTLLDGVHRRGMRLIMDLVVNHTSDEHVWFKQAKTSKDNPYRDYYIWRDEAHPPIGSVFSGSAWEFDSTTNQYYFHLFSKKQPDLNWENPALREEIYKMINFWLDLGIDGFRLDVIDLIGKDMKRGWLCDGPYLDERLKELHANCFFGRDILTVGETPCLSIERVKQVTGSTPPLLSMVFQFGHVGLDEVPGQGKWVLKKLDLVELKKYFKNMQTQLHGQGWNSLFWANHDQPRAVSRYGSLTYRKESAKMLATVLYGMEGTPYVYQGEEIGMTGVRFASLSDYKDIETLNMYEEKRSQGWTHDQIMESIYAKGRDNSRTPMQWDDSQNAGFSSGKPWLDVNPNYETIHVKQDLADPDGVAAYFRRLFELRKSMSVFTDGTFQLLFETDPDVFVYVRENQNDKILVVGSYSDKPKSISFELEQMTNCLLSNMPVQPLNKNTVLPPYYAGIYRFINA
jgi:oligo-1,6-glucosidase/glucan 1,6-alpha-glucosidase